jgi:hypothetical protein
LRNGRWDHLDARISPLSVGQRLAPLFENAFGFRAVKGRLVAVAAENRELDDDLFRLARPPAGHRQFASARFRFGEGDCLAELGARVVGKPLAADSKDDVADEENAIGGRPFSTLVMEICRASVVTIWSQNIQPRSPVGPRFQSCSAFAGMASPLVKSGIVNGWFSPAAKAGSGAEKIATRARVGREVFIMLFLPSFSQFVGVIILTGPKRPDFISGGISV